MSKDRTAKILTVLVLLAALGIGIGRKAKMGSKSAQTPEDAIYQMLDAARSGDIKAYLASYTGEMEAALRQELAENGGPAFARYLRDSNAAIKGVAVSGAPPTNQGQTSLRVEFVYQDRNEAQTMFLERAGSGWKISRVESEQRLKTLIPYGTPVK